MDDGYYLSRTYIYVNFSGGNNILLSALVVRISLQELQLELLVEYALFFSVMGGIGWQFSRRTPSELKNRLHCWLVFSPVYFWLILSNFILYISSEKSALLENIRNFFLTFVWFP